jgi:pyruvate dehydrogenase E2 component (dihydrolipoamide acetyltransferase)
MAAPIIVPELGETMNEATIVRWLKKEGDAVKKGDALLEVQTDKAVLEVESFASGTLLKILAQPGETLPVLQVIGFIGEPGEKLPEVPKAPPTHKPPSLETKAEPRPAAPSRPISEMPAQAVGVPFAAPAPPPVQKPFTISPRAKRLAKERAIDPTKIAGTGPDGRVIERNVLAYLERKGYDSLLISPTARRLAGDLNIDMLDLKGTGPAGKIIKADVLRAEKEKPRPLSQTWRIIASKMVKSAREIPFFLVTLAVDMTELAALREELNKDRVQRISYNDFIVKACAFALRSFPIVNAVCLGGTYKINESINIGIAVDIEDGLIVPVIRDADRKSLDQIVGESAQLVEKAKSKKLLPDEFQGATFTISNMGMLGVESFTAIIPPDQAAILAVGSVTDSVIVHDGKPVVRKIMKITLSSDHRILDGATSARFLNEVKRKLEDPSWAS